MIPRKVHVVWIGPQQLPDREKGLLEVNKRRLSKYHFSLWGNNKLDELAKAYASRPRLVSFVYYCRQNSKWALLSDFIKLHALAAIGGWAIDSDNESLLAPDQYRECRWISGFENYNGMISPITAVMGAVANHGFTALLMHKIYELMPPEIICSHPNTYWISQILVQSGILNNNTDQFAEEIDVRIVPSDVFCGPEVTINTLALHHFSASWMK